MHSHGSPAVSTNSRSHPCSSASQPKPPRPTSSKAKRSTFFSKFFLTFSRHNARMARYQPKKKALIRFALLALICAMLCSILLQYSSSFKQATVIALCFGFLGLLFGAHSLVRSAQHQYPLTIIMSFVAIVSCMLTIATSDDMKHLLKPATTAVAAEPSAPAEPEKSGQ